MDLEVFTTSGIYPWSFIRKSLLLPLFKVGGTRENVDKFLRRCPVFIKQTNDSFKLDKKRDI